MEWGGLMERGLGDDNCVEIMRFVIGGEGSWKAR